MSHHSRLGGLLHPLDCLCVIHPPRSKLNKFTGSLHKDKSSFFFVLSLMPHLGQRDICSCLPRKTHTRVLKLYSAQKTLLCWVAPKYDHKKLSVTSVLCSYWSDELAFSSMLVYCLLRHKVASPFPFLWTKGLAMPMCGCLSPPSQLILHKSIQKLIASTLMRFLSYIYFL